MHTRIEFVRGREAACEINIICSNEKRPKGETTWIKKLDKQ